MQPDKIIKDRSRSALNITDQEIAESIAVDLEEFKADKDKGTNTTGFSSICTGWWSNNWCE